MTDITIPSGMVAWHGGDRAPEDWDGGPVKCRRGDGGLLRCAADSEQWRENIIAYTPKPTPERAEPDQIGAVFVEPVGEGIPAVSREAVLDEIARLIELQRDACPDDEAEHQRNVALSEAADIVRSALSQPSVLALLPASNEAMREALREAVELFGRVPIGELPGKTWDDKLARSRAFLERARSALSEGSVER